MTTLPPAHARFRAAAPVLAVVIAVCFFRLLSADFTWWDDPGTLHHNPHMSPAGWKTLVFYWTTPDQGLYVPVTYTFWTLLARIGNYALPDDYGVFLNPLPFHLAGILVHIVSSLFVLNILRRLFDSEWPAVLGAIFFAIHPIQVESVGWISGFKDLLGWCFTLGATLVYLRAAQAAIATGRRMLKRQWLPWVALLMTLGVLSKPSAMMLPAALVVIDWVMLRRVTFAKAILNIAPLLPIALAAAWIARVVQTADFVYQTPLWFRPLVAADALWFYLCKIAWPLELTIDYGRRPQWVVGRSISYLYLALVIGLAIWIYSRRKDEPRLTGAALLFVVGIAPVLGLTPFQMQYYSTTTDHYLYFSMLAPAIGVAWIAHRWPGAATRGLLMLGLLALGTRTILQTGIWKDSFTLFQHAMRVTPTSAMPHTNLAVMYLSAVRSRPELADPFAEQGYRLDSESYFTIDAYGTTRLALGDVEGAERVWDKIRAIVREHPDSPDIGADMAVRIVSRYFAAKQLDYATKWNDFALEISPRSREALNWQAIIRKAQADRAATRPAPTTTPAPRPASSPAR